MATTHPVPGPVLREARLRLQQGGTLPLEAVDERVARSWQRSLAAGLTPASGMHHVDHLSGSELRQSLACNIDLINHSQPVMEYLFEQVRHSHSMVVLADRHGTLMHTLGTPIFWARPSAWPCRPGPAGMKASVAPTPSAPPWPRPAASRSTARSTTWSATTS